MGGMMKKLTALAGLAVLGTAGPAEAAVLMFDLTGTQTANFSIDTSATPPVGNFNRVQFTNVAGTFNGTNTVASFVRFFQSVSQGGLNIQVGKSLVVNASGPQLFTGTLDQPSFVAGTYQLTTGTLRIADVSALPEPAAWTVMLLGFAGVGVSLRRGRAQPVRV